MFATNQVVPAIYSVTVTNPVSRNRSSSSGVIGGTDGIFESQYQTSVVTQLQKVTDLKFE